MTPTTMIRMKTHSAASARHLGANRLTFITNNDSLHSIIALTRMRFSTDRICSGPPALPPNVRTASPSRNTGTIARRCAWLFASLCAVLLSITWPPAQARAAGTVIAWGYNGQGQTDVPAGLTDVVAVAAGIWHAVALKSDGTVVAWGDNTDGQTDIPAGLSDVITIAAGGRHTVALKADGTVVAWGWNAIGQTDVPAGLTDVIAIAAGEIHTVALQMVAVDNNPPVITVPDDIVVPATSAAGAVVTFSVSATDDAESSVGPASVSRADKIIHTSDEEKESKENIHRPFHPSSLRKFERTATSPP